ncbi:MAG: 3D domain-containing protein [Acidobacteriota bacterium]|nr:3D domain-containing protein [Blastocatellia bacterium]MDW8240195.1 3D domain-containing protein [Acidobacteriota bacterium]
MTYLYYGFIGLTTGFMLVTAIILGVSSGPSLASAQIIATTEPSAQQTAPSPLSQDESGAEVEEVTSNPPDITTDSAGSEKQTLHHFIATAYSLRGTTATGIRVNPGSVAADPSILPMGSVIRLHAGPYSGIYTVLDTGAKVRGKRLDIWLPSQREAIRFGVRKVKVEIIRYGWNPTKK